MKLIAHALHWCHVSVMASEIISCLTNCLSQLTTIKTSNICITGPLCWEFTGHNWNPLIKWPVMWKVCAYFIMINNICSEAKSFVELVSTQPNIYADPAWRQLIRSSKSGLMLPELLLTWLQLQPIKFGWGTRVQQARFKYLVFVCEEYIKLCIV